MTTKWTIICDKCQQEIKEELVRLMGCWQEKEQKHTNENSKDLCWTCWEKGENTEWVNYCEVIWCELNYPSPPEGGQVMRDPKKCKHKKESKNHNFLGGGNSNMPNSIREYLRKNNIQSIHLKNNGKALLIKYANGNTDWLVEKIWTYEQKQIQAYLKGNNLEYLGRGKINYENASDANLAQSNKSSHWLWALGILGSVSIIGGIITYLIYRNKRKLKKNR